MSINKKTKPSIMGFTIIEVVLVLAIAALIFLIVFLAVPALQRSQRDTQRRSDVGRFVSAAQNYSANKRGIIPTNTEVTNGSFANAYLTTSGDQFGDPTTGTYNYVSNAFGSGPDIGTIYYATNATCDTGASVVSTGGGARKFVAVVKLEGGGFYCQNN